MTSNSDKPKVAIIYDFDKTLCTKDMQEYSLIPSLGYETKEFWDVSNGLAEKEQMDHILAYMYTLLDLSKDNLHPITKANLNRMGKDVEFFPGVPDWFSSINSVGESMGLDVQHFIISSGLKEIIEGTSIAKEFESIFACEYLYKDGVAHRPKTIINYTSKTQYLFRINKGALDLSKEFEVNDYMSDRDRPVPFCNMIYIGDGITDIPCMKLVKRYGGHSIALYSKDDSTAKKLFREGRVTHMARADYREGGELYDTVSVMLHLISDGEKLYRKSLGYGETPVDE